MSSRNSFSSCQYLVDEALLSMIVVFLEEFMRCSVSKEWSKNKQSPGTGQKELPQSPQRTQRGTQTLLQRGYFLGRGHIEIPHFVRDGNEELVVALTPPRCRLAPLSQVGRGEGVRVIANPTAKTRHTHATGQSPRQSDNCRIPPA